MRKVYQTLDALIKLAAKEGYKPACQVPGFSVTFYKCGCDCLLYIKEVGGWTRQGGTI